jgi:hypothetical protein
MNGALTRVRPFLTFLACPAIRQCGATMLGRSVMTL